MNGSWFTQCERWYLCRCQHFEVEPEGRVERHLHAFEQAIYVLSGTLAVDVAGTREELGADDFLWIELGVPHAVSSTSGAQWLEVSAPNPGARFQDTVFSESAGATPEVPYRRGHFDVGDLPEPSGNILAGSPGVHAELTAIAKNDPSER
jgi:hypothetical protein